VPGCYIGGLDQDSGGREPALNWVDIDADGDFDLFIGEDATQGIQFYPNVGDPEEPDWQFEPPLPYANLAHYSWFTPVFADPDGDGDLDMMNTSGLEIFYYENLGTAEEPIWPEYDHPFDIVELLCPMETGCYNIEFADLNSDGQLEMFVVDVNDPYASRLIMFQINGWGDDFDIAIQDSFPDASLAAYRFADMDTDGDLDIIGFAGDWNLFEFHLAFVENAGTSTNPEFLPWVSLMELDHPLSRYMGMADVDNDGDKDLCYALHGGELRFLKNQGAPDSMAFVAAVAMPPLMLDLGTQTVPTLVDIDADNDLDLFAGYVERGLAFYRNEGTPQLADWRLVSKTMPELNLENLLVQPTFCDIDDDDDQDLFIGHVYNDNGYTSGRIHFYQNIGTPQSPVFFHITGQYADIVFQYGKCQPDFCDIDNDGDLDLFVYNTSSHQLYFYRNVGTPEEAYFVHENSSPNYGGYVVPTLGDLLYPD